MRLLLVAAGDAGEEWLARLREAGIDARASRGEEVAGAVAALRDPLDLVLVWDDAEGGRGTSVVAAVGAAGAVVPVAVVAHPDAEAGLGRALAAGAAAGLERSRPERLPAELGRILERERFLARMALTGRIAHDLNNLLAPIPLAVQLLHRAPTPDAVGGQLDSVHTASRRSMEAVKELSELLATQAAAPLRLRSKHLLTLASRPWRHLPGTPPTVLTDYPPDLAPVRLDLVRALQFLWCLARRALDRAADHEEGAGALLFSGRNVMPREGGAGVELRVTWSPSADLEGRHGGDRLRAPEPADELEVVVAAAANLGGTVGVLEAGHGAHGFTLLLSAAGGAGARLVEPPRSEPERGHRPAPWPADRRTKGVTDRRSALVIDGDDEVRRMTRETLESSGWEVLTAADGAEGAAVYAESVDGLGAVVVDMSLPYLDGLATIRALRRIGGEATMVLTTCGDWDARRLKASAEGPDAVLRKPYDAETLLRTIAG